MGMGLRLLYNQIIRNFQDTLLSVEMDSAEKQQNISQARYAERPPPTMSVSSQQMPQTIQLPLYV